MTLVNCKLCDAEFDKKPSQIKKSSNHFCSKSCSAIFNNKKTKKRKLTKECKTCDSKIISRRTYCNTCWNDKNVVSKGRTIKNDLIVTTGKKICTTCKKEKDTSDFAKSRTSWCKPCHNKKNREYHYKLKQKCVEYKGGKCEMCGYNKCQAALEFHHVDPTKKDFTIGQLTRRVWDTCKNTIIPELDKCQILCSNCHKETHFKINNSQR